MSDFGSLLTATKVNGTKITQVNITELKTALKVAIDENDFGDALGKPFSSDFQLDSSQLMAIVQLSQHYFGGDPDEDNEIYEFVQEVEESDLEDIVDLLTTQFPEYTFEAKIEEW